MRPPRNIREKPDMRTFIAIPPLNSFSGGLGVLYRIAEYLHQAGHEVRLLPEESGAPGLSEANVPVAPGGWQNSPLRPGDLLFAPEGWPRALMPGLRSGAKTVIYVQAWSFLFSALPPDISLASMPVSFVAVSQPVEWFVRQVTGKPARVLRPGINLERFKAREKSRPGSASKVKIGWMPRKNKAAANQARRIFEARLALNGLPRPEWIEIHNRAPAEVAELMAECHIFLATGFPEGCPLPPLEAMACGCLVVGCSGFGGMDYMRPFRPAEAENSAASPYNWPPLPLLFDARPVPWGPNALVVPDGDLPALALALEEGVKLVLECGEDYRNIVRQGMLAARSYSLEEQRRAVLELWESFQS